MFSAKFPNSVQPFLKLATLTALCLVFAAACAKKTKPDGSDGSGGADGNGANAAAISDKDIGYDAQGSDSGKIDGLSTIYFAYDKSALSAEAKQKLAQNAEWMKAHRKTTVQVEGHTDERGSVEYNLSLGERRAKSVKAYLVSLGVDAKHLTTISYGEEKPIVPGDTEAAWSKNRRANFVPLAQ
jgi:peptidoglycan-associated lipoprotein